MGSGFSTVNAPVSCPLASMVHDVTVPVSNSLLAPSGPVELILALQSADKPRYPEPEIATAAPSPPLFGVRTKVD